MHKSVKRVFEYFCFPDRPTKGGGILDFQKGGNLRKGGGGMNPLTNYVVFKSKGEHLRNQEKCFLFQFKSSSRSRENQCLEFQIFKFHDITKWLNIKQEISLLNNLGSKHNLLIKFGNITNITKEKILLKNSTKTDVKNSSRPFCVCRE